MSGNSRVCIACKACMRLGRNNNSLQGATITAELLSPMAVHCPWQRAVHHIEMLRVCACCCMVCSC